VFPDPESLIRRSPASAPLLDMVKDRKTRDTVRSVIERLTGGGARPAAPDAAVSAPAAAEAAKPNGDTDYVGLLRGFVRAPRGTARAARDTRRALKRLESVA
jgi:hypothetical protein